MEGTAKEGAYEELCGLRTCVPSMIRTLNQVRLFAGLDTTVLIEGETGTGKELVAKGLHLLSHREAGPFVVVDCASLPENLIESELFGHERGAYTGADQFYGGRIQAAHSGTLFLDEVNSITLPMQSKLLRFLETREFCRVGQRRPVTVDVRVITASNVPLDQLVAKQLIRKDFYYRINVLRLELPPLRDRLNDLPFLVDSFLRSDPTAKRLGVTGLPPAALDDLRNRPWPGNVRELHNVLRRLVAVGASAVHREFPDVPGSAGADAEPVAASTGCPTSLPFRKWMRECERMYFSALVGQHGSATARAAVAGLPQRTLYRKLRNHRIGSPGVDGDDRHGRGSHATQEVATGHENQAGTKRSEAAAWGESAPLVAVSTDGPAPRG